MNLCHIHYVEMTFRLYPMGWTCGLCAPVFIVTTSNTSTPSWSGTEGSGQ